MQVIVIGRGQSGTRAIAAALQNAGLAHGTLNPYGDLIPAQAMYKAVREVGQLVRRVGEYEWDFSEVVNTPLSPLYVERVLDYLADLPTDGYFWKLSEATLGLPWLVQLFPNAYYIHWVRDGRDNCLKYHGSEHFRKFAIPANHCKENRIYDGAVSWKYHEDMIEATPKPGNWITVRLEDYVSDKTSVARRLSEYLGRSVEMSAPHTDVVGRWQQLQDNETITQLALAMPILERQLRRHGYIS